MGITDKVFLYALQVLNLGLLWHGFNDSIREGDGDRIMTYYKFILNVFKAGRCFNYSKEVVILLTQYYCLFSERQAAQLKWSRCINTKGYRGCNVPCNLHLGHLNCRLKGDDQRATFQCYAKGFKSCCTICWNCSPSL